ncbi:hypothetical protein BaRGS_00004555 [Batillaria attramentaria]|uniref:CARD domain-containing protein n=1 Tax=Batillaria attramentaria TaxID=370345 RepID=A0ABD0LXQ8_9CAEN
MRSDDERCIQINSLFIEHEVEAKDLAGALYASQIIDSNDRDEILGGTTRLERTRRMIDILLLRGPDAFEIFLTALEDSGYDHVISRLRSTETTFTPKGSVPDFEALLRDGTGASLHLHDPSGLGERLKTIEDLWDILSRRVTRIERRVQELTSTNTHKAALIEDLVGEVQQKTEQLQQAQNRIEELEQRILELETEKAKSSEVVESLREELDQHREHVKHQEDWFNAENLRLKNKLLQQEKAIQQQDSREQEQRMRERLEEQHSDLKEQRQLMEEQSQQLDFLRRHVMHIAISNNTVNNPLEALDEAPPSAENQLPSQDVIHTSASSLPLSKTNSAKDNAHFPSNTNSTGKSNWVKTHRSTINTNNVPDNSNSHQPSTMSGLTTQSFNTPTANSTFCLNVPPTSHAPLSYRSVKRSAPAPLYRAYRKK